MPFFMISLSNGLSWLMTGTTASLVTGMNQAPFWISAGYDFPGNHADVDHVGQSVGDALAGPARRDVEAHVGMELAEFLGPFHHHGIERPGTGNGDRALQLRGDRFLGGE